MLVSEAWGAGVPPFFLSDLTQAHDKMSLPPEVPHTHWYTIEWSLFRVWRGVKWVVETEQSREKERVEK